MGVGVAVVGDAPGEHVRARKRSSLDGKGVLAAAAAMAGAQQASAGSGYIVLHTHTHRIAGERPHMATLRPLLPLRATATSEAETRAAAIFADGAIAGLELPVLCLMRHS